MQHIRSYMQHLMLPSVSSLPQQLKDMCISGVMSAFNLQLYQLVGDYRVSSSTKLRCIRTGSCGLLLTASYQPLLICYLARILNVTVCVLKECTTKVAVWQAKNSLHNILQGDTYWQTKMQCLISLAYHSSLLKCRCFDASVDYQYLTL